MASARATRTYSTSLQRSLSSSLAEWPSRPSSARAPSHRGRTSRAPGKHCSAQIRPPPSSSPPLPSFLIHSLAFLPPLVPVQNPSAACSSPARCVCLFPLGVPCSAEQCGRAGHGVRDIGYQRGSVHGVTSIDLSAGSEAAVSFVGLGI